MDKKVKGFLSKYITFSQTQAGTAVPVKCNFTRTYCSVCASNMTSQNGCTRWFRVYCSNVNESTVQRKEYCIGIQCTRRNNTLSSDYILSENTCIHDAVLQQNKRII
jgi:hypothetical protein